MNTECKAGRSDQFVGKQVSWPAMKWSGVVISVSTLGIRVHWTKKPNNDEPTTGLFSKAAFKRDLIVQEGSK